MRILEGQVAASSLFSESVNAIEEVSKSLLAAQVSPDEVRRVLRGIHWKRDIAKARETLSRFSRGKKHFERSTGLKRQYTAIERELFKLLRVSDSVEEFLRFGLHVVALMPFYAQDRDHNKETRLRR
ncbi:hypothetical protein J7M28_09240 [bacterium]|nr:hypothetical protein [bacterium]